jgi:hypothetical protein
MNEAEFWRIIEMTKIASNGDGEKQAELLVEYLSQLSEGEILDFDYIHEKYMSQAYDSKLWDAAYIIESCGDDSFSDFRAWLIGQGQAVYEAVIANPDDLADFVEIEQATQVESLGYIAMNAYERKTGNDEMPSPRGTHPELNGEFTEHEDFPTKYPKLWAKFSHRWEE